MKKTPCLDWSRRFASRTQWMKRNAVRELLKVTAQPDMISFAGGLPAAELFPLEEAQGSMERVSRLIGRKCLQYAETEGLAELRDWIARKFSGNGLAVRRENVLITTGGQQGLDLIGRVLLEAGDRVAVESPTYLALLSAWRPLGVEWWGVPSDREGLQVNQLSSSGSAPPKLLYLVPNYQNPQGTTLSRERRQALVQLLRSGDMILVEDNPYGDLRYEGDPLPSLFELDAGLEGELSGRVIYTGSFSKVLMPGLRVGWVIAAAEVIDKMVQAKQAADLHTSSLSQYLVQDMIARGVLDRNIPLLCHAYRERRDTMLEALDKHFPSSATWTRPAGGMFLMATLPVTIDTTALLPEAIRQKVAYVPGEEFYIDGQGRNVMRLNFSNATPERIEEGIGRLGVILGRGL